MFDRSTSEAATGQEELLRTHQRRSVKTGKMWRNVVNISAFWRGVITCRGVLVENQSAMNRAREFFAAYVYFL